MHAQDAHSTSRVRRSHDSSHFRKPNAHLTHMPTSAALPATITPRTRAHRHTRRDKPHPPQRHVSIIARIWQSSARQQATHRTPHTRTQHTTHKPARLHDVPLRRNHCALSKHYRMHTAARTPHTARHTAPPPAHCSQKNTHHTRSLRATLTEELSGCPASTGCCQRVGCGPRPTACRTHEQPSRHT
jgi:hypothetical protein